MENSLLFAKNASCYCCVSHQSKKLPLLLLFLSVLLSSTLYAQQTVTGRITSAATPLINVTVQVKGSSTGTQTGADGMFVISTAPNATLVITSVGFASQEIPVANRS